MTHEKVACRTPAEGRDGVTNIPRWKFETMRSAILDAVETAGPNGFPFAKLANAVRERLSEEEQGRIGSLNWHTTCVKLEMEVAGDIARKSGVVPQQLVIARG